MSKANAQETTISVDAAESLFVNNRSFETLRSKLNYFNPIKVMKMERMEIRHSAILAWLLSPQETHGLGDLFLRKFLAEALRGSSKLSPLNALALMHADLRTADIRVEWKNIDIFIECPDQNWAFIIENKFYSSQSQGQLSKYAERVKDHYDTARAQFTICGVFLTLNDEPPHDPSFAPINYASVCELLEDLIATHMDTMPTEVQIFINHYLEIIEEAAGMNQRQQDMEDLARQLYRDHKKIIDFIIQHGSASDFMIAAESLFGENRNKFDLLDTNSPLFRFLTAGNDTISLLPDDWYQALGGDASRWPELASYWGNFPVASWFQLWRSGEGSAGQIAYYAEVGPLADHIYRRSLITEIEKASEEHKRSNIRFMKNAKDPSKKYSKFLKNNTLNINDVQDAEEIAEAMKRLLRKFERDIQVVAEALSKLQLPD